MSKKRRFSDVESLSDRTSQFNWNLCIICQSHTNVKLLCPAGIQRANYDPVETYTKLISNLGRFKELDCLPCPVSLPDELSNTSILFDNFAKYHKYA